VSEAQSRRRRRVLPPEPPSQYIRVYCPACGEVQWGYDGHRNLYGTTVRTHSTWALADGPQKNPYAASEPLRLTLCDGGEVDLEKDRAP
jgi:hypothetical protein